jgi:hypothetical protein
VSTRKKKNLTFALMGVVSLALLTGLLTTIRVRSQQGKANGQAQPTAKELDDAATPIVDSNSEDVADVKRQHQNRRHNHGGLEVAETPDTSTEVTVSSESSMPDF